MARGPPSAPRIQTVLVGWTVAFGAAALLATGGLILATSLLQRATAASLRDTRSMAAVAELQMALLTYQRASNLQVVDPSPDLHRAREELADEIRRLLGVAERNVVDGREAELVDAAAQAANTYLQIREAVGPGERLRDVVARSDEPLDRALAQLEQLRRRNQQRLLAAHAQADRIDALANAAGTLAALLMLIGTLVMIVGTRRHLIRPLLDLHDAIAHFRAGDGTARAPVHGAPEICDIAKLFNEMAAALERDRSNQLAFLAAVAHDLRNPLAPLRLSVASLNRVPEARRERTLAMIERQVDRLSRMLDDLLDASRIEAGQLDLQLQVVDLGRILDGVADLYATTAKDHTITLHLPDQPVHLWADPVRVEQVVENLMSNAIKFSPAGGPVDVAIEQRQDEAVLTVEDRGVGLTVQDIQNMFLPFRRGRPSLASGSGLGLSIVRRIVNAHGGTIEAHPRPGGGATFCVRLPLLGAARGAPDHARARTPPDDPPPAPGP